MMIAEADARIEHDVFFWLPRLHERRHACLKNVQDFVHHVAVMGILLHGAGPHARTAVHEHVAGAVLGEHVGHGRFPQAGRNVVDDVRTGLEHGRGHVGAPGVHGKQRVRRNAASAALVKGPHARPHTPQFVVRRNVLRAGTRGGPAEIEHSGSICGEAS